MGNQLMQGEIISLTKMIDNWLNLSSHPRELHLKGSLGDVSIDFRGDTYMDSESRFYQYIISTEYKGVEFGQVIFFCDQESQKQSYEWATGFERYARERAEVNMEDLRREGVDLATKILTEGHA